MKTKMKTKARTTKKAKEKEKKAYGVGKGRRVSAKCKKTRLKREMAKERVVDKSALEREEGLVCMGDRCFCHRQKRKSNGAQCRCACRKEGEKCDAMF